jgi:hypothetical protein
MKGQYFNLEQAIADWRRQMKGGIKSREVLDELENHLREDVKQQVQSGKTIQQAFKIAVQRLGSVRALKTEFEKTAETNCPSFRENLWSIMSIGFCLFIVSAGICYFAILPLATRATDQYSAWMGFKTHQWLAKEQFGFVCKFVIGMGFGFAMPVGLLTLVRIRILEYETLVRLRPYSIIVNLILGALLTTPEVFTQIMMFIPLQLLFEISVWIAKCWDRRRNYV